MTGIDHNSLGIEAIAAIMACLASAATSVKELPSLRTV